MIFRKVHPVSVSRESWLEPLQAHRGSAQNPEFENTLEAFRHAKKSGFRMIEMDVRLTLDKVPIVFHDHDLKRMASKDTFVRDCTFAEIQKELPQVSSLEDVLLSTDIPEKINLEIKYETTWPVEACLEISKVIEKTQTQDRLMFSSFHPLALSMMSVFLPDIPRGLLVTDEDHEKNKWYLKKRLFQGLAQVHFLNLDYQMVPVDSVKIWKESHVPLILWTVNDLDLIRAYLQAGAVSIITDLIPADIGQLVMDAVHLSR